MQQHQVLELIETVVRPLREKIDHLEKQNEQLKAQIFSVMNPYGQKRLRSISKDRKYLIKKQEVKDTKQIKDTKSPSVKKKDNHKPVWGTGKPVIKNQHLTLKSPPPTDKARLGIKSPRSTATIKPLTQQIKSQQSSEGMKQMSQTAKKIIGGKKVDEQQVKLINTVNSVKEQQKKSTTEQQHNTNNEQDVNNQYQQQYINNEEELIHNEINNKSQKSVTSQNRNALDNVY